MISLSDLVRDARELLSIVPVSDVAWLPRLSDLVVDALKTASVGVNVRNVEATDRAIARFDNPRLTVRSWTPISCTDLVRSLGHSVMKECLHAVPSAKYATDISILEGDLPISSYEHDSSMLLFGRRSAKTGELAPLCQYATTDSCSVDQLPFAGSGDEASRGCQVYLTPDEEKVFQATGKVSPGPCLMCIRRELTTLAYQYSGSVTPQKITEGPKIVPPFTNVINIHNGYRQDAIIDTPLIVGCVVRMDGTCHVAYNPEIKRWGVDQRHLMWIPDAGPVAPLN